MTSAHPDPDDLADLAADVLDPEADAALRSHVSDCDECAGLLDEATRIRSLLLAEDPGPMPGEVWERIELALANEVAAVGARAASSPSATPAESSDSVTSAVPSPSGSPSSASPSSASPSSGSPSSGSLTLLPGSAHVESAPSVESAVSGEDDRPTAKLRRPIRSTHTTRRQRKEDHGGWWGNARSNIGWGGLAAVAAGVLVVVGLGGTLIHGLLPDGSSINPASMLAQDGDSGPSEDERVAGALDSGTPKSVVVSTNTNYQPSKLVDQVRALVDKVHGSASTRSTAAEGGKPAAEEANTFFDDDLPAGAWSAAELAQCLKAIDAEDLSPVAVDFARFDGREVALLVLPSPSKEYEVWAVSRSCKPGADGTQFFQIVKP